MNLEIYKILNLTVLCCSLSLVILCWYYRTVVVCQMLMRRCSPWQDLSKLNRNPAKVLYLSGHALEGCLQHENCVPIKPWLQTDKDDTALLDFIPFLECKLTHKICSTRNLCLKLLLLWHLIHTKIALSPSFSMCSCCP